MANDIVFGAGLDGVIRAFDCDTGEERWWFQAGAGVNAAPAIAGDMGFVPAGAFLTGAEDATPRAELLEFRLAGAGSGATPAAFPASSLPAPGA